MPTEIELRTTIKHVIFYNANNKYCVLECVNTTDKSIFSGIKVSITGLFDNPMEWMNIHLIGVVEDTQYGKQIKASRIELDLDENSTSEQSITSIICALKDPKTGLKVPKQVAKEAYSLYGKDIINQISKNPEEYLGNTAIKTTQRMRQRLINIIGEILLRKSTAKAINTCSKLGFKGYLSNKVFKFCEENPEEANYILDSISKNPYSIYDFGISVSFQTIDTPALTVCNIPFDDEKRLKYGFKYCIESLLSETSSTGVGENELYTRFYKALKFDGKGLSNSKVSEYFFRIIETLKGQKFLRVEDHPTLNRIYYVSRYYQIERVIASDLLRMRTEKLEVPVKDSTIDSVISGMSFKLNEAQEQAIRGILKSKVSVLTGGPGTGKSTIIKVVSDCFERSGYSCRLLAPTGKAARRMTECTGNQAYTMHSYLFRLGTAMQSGKDEEELIPDSRTVFIIDECSMADIFIMDQVFSAISYGNSSVIFVGDKDQLPSIRVGNLLGDVITSGEIPVFELTKIMRQSEGSGIVRLCKCVNSGEIIKQMTVRSKDIVIDTRGSESNFSFDGDIMPIILNYYNESGIENVAVISPYKERTFGVKALNTMISDHLAKIGMIESKRDPVFTNFRVGDRIMITRNNMEKGIVNGDMGKIKSFSGKKDGKYFVTVELDSNLVLDFDSYEAMDYLSLAYCFTVHKTQGSEYKKVLLILTDPYDIIYSKKLLYTAISRAKEHVTILNSAGRSGRIENTNLNKCITTNKVIKRITKLESFLKDNVTCDRRSDIMKAIAEMRQSLVDSV